MSERMINADVMDSLREIPDRSVHVCVTSPPYWGLRDYGTGTWEGGDPACQHRVGGQVQDGKAPLAITTGQRPGVDASRCKDCGAVRVDRQLGLEKTLDCLGWATKQECGECYVCRMVGVFREVRRVLRNDATAWVNMGDSYTAGGRIGHGTRIGYKQQTNRGMNGISDPERSPDPDGLKPKDLCMVPARLALALQADGWYLRSDIAWCKKAPMPESVTDRPTTAWEHIFLLSKSKKYYYDNEAVKEPSTMNPVDWNDNGTTKRDSHVRGEFGGKSVESGKEPFRAISPTRNLRNFWFLGPEPYPLAHFAIFPSEIPRRAIRAGSSAKGCCPACGNPWVRVMEKGSLVSNSGRELSTHGPKGNANKDNSYNDDNFKPGHRYEIRTTGWSPSCSCSPADPIPCTVLDPFMGSGTTAAVARQEGRSWIGIELNPAYCELIRERLNGVARQEAMVL